MKSRITEFFLKHFAAALIGLLLMVTFFATVGMIGSIKDNLEDFRMISSPDVSGDAVAAAIGEQYLVCEYDGRIGVFVPGDSEPVSVVQVYVAYLPESDRTALRQGISVSGRKALEALLDDFRS